MSTGTSGFRALTRAMWRGVIRDRTSLFFYFLFPLMFLLLFGLVFDSADSSRFTVGVTGGGSVVEALPEQVLDIKSYDDFDDAVAAVEDGDIPAAIRQQGDVVEVRYSASSQVSAGAVQGIVSSVVGSENLAESGEAPRYRLEASQVEDSSFQPIQYLTSGILAWAVSMAAAFGAALNLVTWRKQRLLRRIRLSPVPTTSVVGARVGVGVSIAMLQGAVFIGIAATPPFGLQLTWASLMIIPLLVAGTLAFMSIGILVGSVVKTEEAASGAINLIILPMAFLSGVFFDVSAMPGWIQGISWLFPMRHMSAGMLDVLVRDQGLGPVLTNLAVLVGFAVVLGGLAAYFFSWDD